MMRLGVDQGLGPLGAPEALKPAIFVTRDGYLSNMRVDVRYHVIDVEIVSLDSARNGQTLTFVRQGPVGQFVSLYEELPPS